MSDWEDEREQVINNIREELNLLGTEVDKLMVLSEVVKTLDKSKMPPTIRKNIDFEP